MHTVQHDNYTTSTPQLLLLCNVAHARWKDDVQNDIRKMRIVNWRHVAQDKDGQRRATMEALILLG
jgi:hypothetical protein